MGPSSASSWASRSALSTDSIAYAGLFFTPETIFLLPDRLARVRHHGQDRAMSDPLRPPLESVDRALRLIEALADGRILTVKEAADLLEVAPSTAHRLLAALKFRRFAVQDGDRGYRAGTALQVGELDLMHADRLRMAAAPALALLHAEVDECAQLMVLRGTDIVFLDGAESFRPLRVAVRIGDRIPAHCSAGGKAILAELGTEGLSALYAEGLPTWPSASITDLTALRRQLAQVRSQGYGVNHNETEDGVSGVGVALHDASGQAVAALTLAVPSARFSRADLPAYAELLHRAARLAEPALPAARLP